MEISVLTALTPILEPSPDWDPLSPDATSAESRRYRVRDRHGIVRVVDVFFRREDDSERNRSCDVVYTARVLVDGSAIRHGVAGVPFEAECYRLDFAPDGSLYSRAPQCTLSRDNRTGGFRNRWHWKESDPAERASDRIKVDFSGCEVAS